MPSPAELVASTFTLAQTYAASAQTSLGTFTSALNSTLYQPPTISLAWKSIAEPTLPNLPATPTMPAISFVSPTAPADFSVADPTITIDDFTITDPTLNLPTAPTISYGVVPSVPNIGTVAIPDAPTLNTVATPTFLALNTPTFAGVDLRPDYLSKLEDIPALDLVSPTPYSYTAGPKYASNLLSTLQAVLTARMAGGTGLAPAVEQAIWDRARSRETQTSLANQAEVMRSSEAMGFQLPTGVLAAQLREAQRDYYGKLSSLSRDIAIKQADLEQENLKQTITQGMEMEGKLITYCFQTEQLAFESAKTVAENAIQVHNAALERYKALLSAFQAYASAYKTIIEGELAKVDVYKAQLSAEQTKASINASLVQQFKAQIEASMAYVEIYKAQVSAAQTLVGLEQAKIGAAGEQVRAYIAQVNAETSKVEAYKAGVQAEASKVEIYKAKTAAFAAKSGAQAERARANISLYSALAQGNAAKWDGYKARVGAERDRIAALTSQTGALTDIYRAGATAIEAQAGLQTKVWETRIKDYEAVQHLTLQTAKINGDFVMATNNARQDAAKVGAQVYAQLASSAYSMMHTGASVSGSAGMSVSYSYSNDTASTAPTITSI